MPYPERLEGRHPTIRLPRGRRSLRGYDEYGFRACLDHVIEYMPNCPLWAGVGSDGTVTRDGFPMLACRGTEGDPYERVSYVELVTATAAQREVLANSGLCVFVRKGRSGRKSMSLPIMPVQVAIVLFRALWPGNIDGKGGERKVWDELWYHMARKYFHGWTASAYRRNKSH